MQYLAGIILAGVLAVAGASPVMAGRGEAAVQRPQQAPVAVAQLCTLPLSGDT